MRKIAALFTVMVVSGFAQGPPAYSPRDLDGMVARIALYPDPLLAQVLAAATYSDQIPEAANWADQHHYVTGPALADAMANDQLPWDPSVQALLPFPSVLGMMASNLNWTRDLGDAFMGQPQDVMDAVQRMRQEASNYGYLRSNGQVMVSGGPYITIMPVRPDYIVVPYYDPAIVYARPRPGFAIRGAIRFNFGVSIGVVFRPWGWGYNRFDWGGHVVIVNNAPWRGNWANRRSYVHPYTVRRSEPPRRIEDRHPLRPQNPRERSAAGEGRKRVEDHRGRDLKDRRDRGHN